MKSRCSRPSSDWNSGSSLASDQDRKSTRLNSSHSQISYAVFCLKKNSQGPVDEIVNAGAKAAASPKDVAAQCDVLITMLPNSPDVELVALGPNGIIEGARRGLILADMSTISPIVSKEVGEALAAKGAA